MSWHGAHAFLLICFPHERDSSDVFATEHQAAVGTLSSQVMLQPVSVPLQNGFRFFRHLTPALSQRALRFRLLVEWAKLRGFHVPCIRPYRRVRSTLSTRKGLAPG